MIPASLGTPVATCQSPAPDQHRRDRAGAVKPNPAAVVARTLDADAGDPGEGVAAAVDVREVAGGDSDWRPGSAPRHDGHAAPARTSTANVRPSSPDQSSPVTCPFTGGRRERGRDRGGDRAGSGRAPTGRNQHHREARTEVAANRFHRSSCIGLTGSPRP